MYYSLTRFDGRTVFMVNQVQMSRAGMLGDSGGSVYLGATASGLVSAQRLRHLGLLVLGKAVLAAAVTCILIAGCTGQQISPQPSGGPGWTLVEMQTLTQNPEGMTVQEVGADKYLVAITVLGPGGGGCGQPRLVGFETSGDTLVAKIERSPMGDICAVVSGVTYHVLLDRQAIPSGVTKISHSESCAAPGCLGAGVPIPAP